MEKCYLLKVDYNQCIDDFMTIHKLDNHDMDLHHLLNSSKYEFERNKIYARVNVSHVEKFDFIANDLRIPIISRKFIEEVDLKTDQQIKLVPMELLDDTISGVLFDKYGNLQKRVRSLTDFYTIKFNLQHDFCNKQESNFRKLKSQLDSLGILKTAVLNYPKGGFPKIFRIKESISMLFISQKTKESIENAKIKGCLFEEVQVIASDI